MHRFAHVDLVFTLFMSRTNCLCWRAAYLGKLPCVTSSLSGVVLSINSYLQSNVYR